jgi:hypothetical protein
MRVEPVVVRHLPKRDEHHNGKVSAWTFEVFPQEGTFAMVEIQISANKAANVGGRIPGDTPFETARDMARREGIHLLTVKLLEAEHG